MAANCVLSFTKLDTLVHENPIRASDLGDGTITSGTSGDSAFKKLFGWDVSLTFRFMDLAALLESKSLSALDLFV